jgi:tetratricopeptide (TPR) repeat protein
MKTNSAIDKNYLRLQFWNKVYQKNATEFQSFFEKIMLLAFPGFHKIRPYGNKGDGGNDGYKPDEGVYYQVYAPRKPDEKEAQAAKKLKEDFNTLKKNWDKISTIKTYYFVFNDKGGGVSIEIESALSELKQDNPTIIFKEFLTKDLEDIFFGLTDQQILSVGFDIDSTKTLKLVREILGKLEVELDRDNTKFVEKTLNNNQDIVFSLNDDSLNLDFEILYARTLQKLERVKEASIKYKSLSKRYPSDPRPILYQAEIQLNNDDFKKNKELLAQAEVIDKDYWLLALEELIRSYVTKEKVDLSNVDEKDFPQDPKIKASFYRIYSGFFEEVGDHVKADCFIERAINLYPDKFANYDARLTILESRFYFIEEEKEQKIQRVKSFIKEIDSIGEKISTWEELGARNKAIIGYRRFNAYQILEDFPLAEQNAKVCFEHLLQCYFDRIIDNLLIGILTPIELPESDLERLLIYLDTAEKRISDALAKRIVLQFILKDTLYTKGEDYFQKICNKRIYDFIHHLEEKNHDKVLEFLADDPLFAIAVANTIKGSPDLRLKIIESLPNDGSVQKDKLLLLLNYDEGDIDEAFNLLKKFDLSNLGYLESREVLKIASGKKAWDFVAILLENLIRQEKNIKALLNFKLQLFTAYFNLGKFKEAAQIGEDILSNNEELNVLDGGNKENLLGQTILARVRRGEFKVAQELMESHMSLFKTSESVLGIKVDVYLKNNDAEKALAAIVEGIKLIKTPTPEQYGGLFFYFVEIDNLIGLPMYPLEEIVDGCFVKLKDQDRWYFVGDGDELDATKILPDNEAYKLFVKKKVGEEIEFEEKYRANVSKFEVEDVHPIEKYISWQCKYNAEKLTVEKRWKAMEIIDLPSTATGIDTKYIIARLEDDRKARGQFLEMYAQGPLPLAFLALNQGGLTEAIGCIVNEQKGYIHFSSGDIDEFNQQKEIAKRIISGEKFYIDGTSALVLGETYLLHDIYQYLPGLMIPQSVITLLLDINDKFRFIPGQTGHMAYSQGKLVISSNDAEKRKRIRDNFAKVIRLLESKPENIQVISEANKTGEFSERRVEPSLSDACILAQREGYLVLTEDYLYLKVNELDTKKRAPEYCSSFALTRVLYEQGKIGFDKYLDFFSYLSSYRFRFLPITVDDIEKSVFGGNDVKVFSPKKIRLLNFPLTLSEDYGVSFDRAFTVVGQFLIKILIDDAVVSEMMEKIFIEIVESFPTKDKNQFGQLLLGISVKVINKAQKDIILGRNIQKKVNSISKLIEIYKSKDIILP